MTETHCNICNTPHPNGVYLWEDELGDLDYTCLCGICYTDLTYKAAVERKGE